MKIFGAVFWAVVLIAIGVVVILKQAFGWNISIFAIVLGIILISVGISIVTRPSRSDKNMVFAGGHERVVAGKDNNYIFSDVTLVLSDDNNQEIEINCIFSSVKLHTQGKSVYIRSTGAFSNTVLPDNTHLAFGDRIYERDGENTIKITTNCVFGEIVID